MSITAAEFKIRFPEFVSESETRIDMFIEDAVVVLNEAYWGAKYNLGLYYYTAHILVLANRTDSGNVGSVAPVSGRSVDGASVSYSTGNMATGGNDGDAWLNSTQYGQRYIALRKNLGVAACDI